MALEIRQATRRFVTEAEGRTTWHSFSFGAHYDPDNIGFGALVAHNDELLPLGTGYPDHPHVDTEIVTFVLSGALRHTSDVGTRLLGPGSVQRLSAGSGVIHSEISEADADTRFIQAWVRPDESGLTPSYDAATGVDEGPMVPIVGAGGLGINSSGAGFFVSRLGPGEQTALPEAPYVHLFVAEGCALLGDYALATNDSARLVGQGGRIVTGDEGGTRLLVWAFSQPS